MREVPAVYMRGGTSRALMFHRRDLPDATPDDGYAAWSDMFLTALGSPDPGGRQLDGIGGGISSLSKVAVIAPSTRPDADVDYTFAQVGVLTATIGYRGNCGNISAAVGPFAVDERLTQVEGDSATVRIHNTNTGKIIRATFPVRQGRAVPEGDFVVQGVAGSGAPIRLDFLDPAGATTGSLLPSGALREVLELPDGAAVAVSLVDAANPVCFARACDFGLTGRETPAQIAGDAVLMEGLVALRIAASVRMGLVTEATEARTTLTNLPLVCLLARPDPSRYDGEADVDLVIRMLSADQPHKATPLTGALCTAAAAGLQGSLVAEFLADGCDPKLLRLRHASGALPVAVETDGGSIRSASVFRTARTIMRGVVYC